MEKITECHGCGSIENGIHVSQCSLCNMYTCEICSSSDDACGECHGDKKHIGIIGEDFVLDE